jgi:hypothetical protein
MRSYEFIREEIEEEHDDIQDNILVDTLMFIKNNGMTEIETLALISMVQRNGLDGFSYEALLDANEADPTIKSLVKSIDPRKVKMSPDTNSVVNNPEEENGGYDPEASADIVGGMAKKALTNRQ